MCQTIHHLTQERVRSGDVGVEAGGGEGGEELGDGGDGGSEEFLLGGGEPEFVPAVHFAGVGEGLSEGVVGEIALHPGREEEGDGSLMSGVEIVAESPQAHGVVAVVEGPE